LSVGLAPVDPVMTAPSGAAFEAAACRHCGLAVAPGQSFCCAGCQAAFEVIHGLGLGRYYQRRSLDPQAPALRPDADAPAMDFSAFVKDHGDGTESLHLMVDGLQCAACVWLIEAVLAQEPGVVSARLNMTTRRLALVWRSAETSAAHLAQAVMRLGYRLAPFDAERLDSATGARERELLRAMAVAGFAAGNVMLLSVSIWAGHVEGMGPATRTFLHWISALIALPAVAYAGRPFFRSAVGALRVRRVNMDVPISLGILLAAGMSLQQTWAGADHAYFDSAVTLLFFLLVGRYLDSRVRSRARSVIEHLLHLSGRAVTVVLPSGEHRSLAPSRVEIGARVLVAAGERVGVDGLVRDGRSQLDTALIDGESTPKPAAPGTRVFAGTLNLASPLQVEVTAVGDGTLLAEIVRLVEAGECARGRHVALADRVARFYAPVVHSAALLTFLGWWLGAGAPWQDSLLTAIAVLIITCPCALALAVPVVQVVASGRLLKRGILVKSGTAFERLAEADTIVFDKTGTLTEGTPELLDLDPIEDADIALAAGLALQSRHPLARALVRAAAARAVAPIAVNGVVEVAGRGLEAPTPAGPIRLGSREFCGESQVRDKEGGPELWLRRPDGKSVRFAFADRAREDAAGVIAVLRRQGYAITLLSGDREPAVAAIARQLAIEDWRAGCDPAGKLARLQALADQGRRVLMVGDGLNDAPALAGAHVAMSPAQAADVSRTAADVVFQGSRLSPVVDTLWVARRAQALVRQNLALAFLYNLVTVPLAVAGLVTPLVAAISMSASSLVVIVNALRLGRGRLAWTSSSG
jgi:Cu2+-exporting ATPase